MCRIAIDVETVLLAIITLGGDNSCISFHKILYILYRWQPLTATTLRRDTADVHIEDSGVCTFSTSTACAITHDTSYAVASSAGGLEGRRPSNILSSRALWRLRRHNAREREIVGRFRLPKPHHRVSRVRLHYVIISST